MLASNDFSTHEALGLLEHVRSAQGAEPKFTTLRKSDAGIAKLARFMSDPLLTKDRVAVYVFHKPYMVVTKLVDIVVETLYHQQGGDLYADGQNQALSNMLYHCLPEFCGEENSDRFLHAFVDLVRGRGEKERLAFYAAARQLVETCSEEKFKDYLEPFAAPELFHRWFNDQIDKLALDPAIPALFAHIAEWGRRTSARFDVVHDDSKPIIASQSTFKAMMALVNQQSQEIGYDRRKFGFPLRAQSLTQADSRLHPQLQVADLCAGLINHLVKCREAAAFDSLADRILEFDVPRWVFDGIMPSLSITPQELGTAERGGINPVEGMLDHLTRSCLS
ncbi:hypothetical protein SAMN05216567_13217 [Variovorax sp. OK605]|nr:hypothetical protein SAMN05216567_13217 [Variovorax sp. OK605]